MTHMASSNSSTNLNLGNVPAGIEDPAIYEAILNIHTAIEALLTSFDDIDTGVFATVNIIEAYMNARTHVITVSADYTVLTTNGTIIIDASLNTVTVSLPTAVPLLGTRFVIKCASNSYLADVAPFGVETIDGDTGNFELYEDESIVLQSDGANWIII